MNELTIVELFLSALLFLVIFFGIGFLVNMLLRMTWFTAIIYPIIVIFIIDEVKFYEYITNAKEAFSLLGTKISNLHTADIIILSSGFVGTIIAGIVMKILRKQGYQMF
ncbi:MAG TPA: YuiB family protein [Savagea sp.]